MKTSGRYLFVIALGSTATTLSAQLPPIGSELQVNTYTTNDQVHPRIASLGQGSFVVVWFSQSQDGDGFGLFGQRFDGLGSEAGPEFPVNTYTTGTQDFQSVASDAAGDFVVVWQGPQDGSAYGVIGQRFDASGARAGSEFLVNTYTTDSEGDPSVAMDAAGDFVVVWERSPTPEGSGYDIRGQRFDSSGARVGSEFQVGSHSAGVTTRKRVAMAPTGEFVVVWSGPRTAGSGYGVIGQRFDDSGAKVGGEFPVDSGTSAVAFQPAIAIDHRGDFVVVWCAPDGSGYGVFGQRFNRSAEKVGPVFPVNSYTDQEQLGPDVAFDPSGKFVVVWSSQLQDGSDAGIFGQRFDRSGGKIGPEIPLNTFTTGLQADPAVVTDGPGFAAVWTSNAEDGDRDGTFGRRQEFDPEALSVDRIAAPDTSSDANGVLEPGETVLVEPTWSNRGESTPHLTGHTSALPCAFGTTCVTATGVNADYGTLSPGEIVHCNNGDPEGCFRVAASGPRPGTHWDGSFIESLSVGGGQRWTLHVGDSFSDVPRSEPFYRKIETLLHNGITSGCTTTTYCPTVPVPRDQMAIFVAKGIAGLGEYVPTSGTLNGLPYDCEGGGVSRFSDVSPTDPACRHVHYLGVQNVTLGCSATMYCPTDPITRDAMASFIAKAIVAPAGGAGIPMTYTDPDTGRSYSCTIGSPNIHFTDVPATSTFCRHIHYLWARGIVDGCSATQYCPSQTVNRDAMAKFIANGFGLQLYGP